MQGTAAVRGDQIIAIAAKYVQPSQPIHRLAGWRRGGDMDHIIARTAIHGGYVVAILAAIAFPIRGRVRVIQARHHMNGDIVIATAAIHPGKGFAARIGIIPRPQIDEFAAAIAAGHRIIARARKDRRRRIGQGDDVIAGRATLPMHQMIGVEGAVLRRVEPQVFLGQIIHPQHRECGGPAIMQHFDQTVCAVRSDGDALGR